MRLRGSRVIRMLTRVGALSRTRGWKVVVVSEGEAECTLKSNVGSNATNRKNASF